MKPHHVTTDNKQEHFTWESETIDLEQTTLISTSSVLIYQKKLAWQKQELQMDLVK